MKKLQLVLLNSIITIAITACGGGSTNNARPTIPAVEAIPEIDYQQVLNETLTDQIPGIILLVESPERKFIGSVGLADIESQQPMETFHTMPTGSAGKPMIALLLIQLHQQGVLNLEDNIAQYLQANLISQIENGERISIRQLLNHTSGIYNFTENEHLDTDILLGDPNKLKTDVYFVNYALNKPAYFEPGLGFHYSNTNYSLAGLILDEITGDHHSKLLRETLLNPLGLDSTYYIGVENELGDRISGYQMIDGQRINTKVFIENFAPASAPVVATVEDLALFMRTLISDESFVNNDVRELMYAEEFSTELKPNSFYGLGIEKHLMNNKTVFAHAGGYAGYTTENFFIKDTQTSITAFINCNDDVCQQALSDLTDKVLTNELK